MARLFGGALVAVALETSSLAHADPATCADAALQAQTLRSSHKLRESRDELRVCAREDCPSVVQKDCVAWLAEVERSLPSVVFAARDSAGRDVIDVRVVLDGEPVVAHLDGEAIPVNPGVHHVVFERSNGTGATVDVLVNEGEKNKPVAAVLPLVMPKPSDETLRREVEARRVRTLAYVVGGAGIVGAGVGTLFGLLAVSEKSRAGCDTAGLCDIGPLSAARRDATVSTAGFVSGAALLASGVSILLLAPRDGGRSITVAPSVGMSGAGVMMRGAW